MTTETKKQTIRYLVHEGVAGNFAPMEKHPGLREILPTVQLLHERTQNQQVTFPLQFMDGEWVATVQSMSYTATAPLFGDIQPGQQMSYEMLSFNRFEGDQIVQQHSQVDVGSVIAQSQGESPVEWQYAQSGQPSLSADDACALVQHLIEASVAGNYAELEGHSAFKEMIPVVEQRRANTAQVQVSFPVIFSDGEWIAVRSFWNQAVRGQMFGVDADGKHLEFEVLSIHQLEGGHIVFSREFPDLSAMRRQLGLIP